LKAWKELKRRAMKMAPEKRMNDSANEIVSCGEARPYLLE